MTLVSRCSSSFADLSSSSLLTLLKSCKTLRNLEQVHAQIIGKGSEQDHFLVTHFISLCNSIFSNLSYPTTVFDRVSAPNIYLWNSLIKLYSDHSSFSNSVAIFNRMRKSSSIAPDQCTFPSLIKACSSVLALKQGQCFHGLVVRCGTGSDVYVGSSLVDFYGKCKEIVMARKLFDEMPVRNEVSWTAMVVGYVNLGDVLTAKKLFDEMPLRNLASWNAMISGFLKSGDLKGARKVFDEMPERNKVSFTTMINGYAKAGDMVAARLLFDHTPERDIVSWSALISGYSQNGQPDEAVKLFTELLSTSIKPDEYVMVSLMSACSQLGCVQLAKWVDSYVSQSSLDICRAHVAAALVDMNAKCGNMKKATLLFEAMPNRDMISYCSMIQGMSIHGRGAQAVELFDQMVKEGLKPDHVAFTVILTACSRAGLVEEGCRYFNSMINDYSVEPSPDHYACMLDLLGRSGKLKAAYKLIESMPVEPHAGAWGALLGACKLHCDAELGEEIARRLIEMEPCNAGNYVLLASIYAAADRWLEVSRLRSEMTDRGVRKIPGCSWV